MSSASTTSTNLALWNQLQRVPLGNWLFTRGLRVKAPFFGTVRPLVHELRPGYCRASAPNRRGSRNHLGTYHATASCTMAELVAGLMTDATVPNTHRWIPAGMTVEYKSKCTTAVTAVATLDPVPEFGDDATEVIVPVEITDERGIVYFSARITMKVSPKTR